MLSGNKIHIDSVVPELSQTYICHFCTTVSYLLADIYTYTDKLKLADDTDQVDVPI